LLNSENIPLAFVRKVSGGGGGFPQSRPWVGLEPDAGKGILPRRKNEDHGGPRRGVDESGVATVQTVPVYDQSKMRPMSRNRRDRQHDLMRNEHRDPGQGRRSSLDRRFRSEADATQKKSPWSFVILVLPPCEILPKRERIPLVAQHNPSHFNPRAAIGLIKSSAGPAVDQIVQTELLPAITCKTQSSHDRKHPGEVNPLAGISHDGTRKGNAPAFTMFSTRPRSDFTIPTSK
jgi:hypothetical protein